MTKAPGVRRALFFALIVWSGKQVGDLVRLHRGAFIEADDYAFWSDKLGVHSLILNKAADLEVDGCAAEIGV